MARSTLTSLLKQLDVQSSHNEHAEVETTCISLLEGGCANPTQILKNLLVSLIKQDKYQKAFHQLNKYKTNDKVVLDDMILEVGYIYYKIGRYEDFEKLRIYEKVKDINAIKENDLNRGLSHLYAQCALRNEKTNDRAYELYRNLVQTNLEEVDNSLELACNERVPLTTNPNLQGNLPLISETNPDSYDMLYNESLILTANGEYTQSIELLEKSLQMAIDEGYDNDIFTIQLQLSYVHQISGNNKKCKEILKPLIDRIPNENPLHLIAKNNYMALRDLSKYEDNFNLILRELNFEKINSLNNKFTYQQNTLFKRNFQILSLFNNSVSKPDKKLSGYENVTKLYGSLIDDVVLEPYRTQAKILYRKCLSLNGSHYENPLNFALLLVTIQILFKEKQYGKAIELCRHYLKTRTREFFINLPISFITYILVQLYDITGDDVKKSNLLDSTCLRTPFECFPHFDFWKYVGFQYLNLGNTQSAMEIFNKTIPSELTSADDLIISVLDNKNIDDNKTSSLVEDVNIEELIELGSEPFESVTKKQRAKEIKENKIKKDRLKVIKEKRKAQKLKTFLARRGDSINLDAKPDPERWLPLKDRSTYRPKKKQLAKQTQGGAMSKKAEQSLDITKKNTDKKKGKGKGKSKGKGRK